MKLKENFFSSERMVVLEMMPDGILYSNLLLKMYLMSLKHNGILLLHENLPHTPQTIATFTRHQIGTVERALQIFLKLGFVELLTDGAYYMPDSGAFFAQTFAPCLLHFGAALANVYSDDDSAIFCRSIEETENSRSTVGHKAFLLQPDNRAADLDGQVFSLN